MATRNIVPRADGEGSLGTSAKAWGCIYADNAIIDGKPVSSLGMPIGYEYFTVNPNVPDGSLPLLGGEYSRVAYADLWSWVQTQTGYLITDAAWAALSNSQNGNVPFYSSGDGSTTFRVPALKCWIKGKNGTEIVGTYLDAGLPNITGGFAAYAYGSGGYSGSFLSSISSSAALPSGTGADSKNYNTYTIDASRSSSIYGNSNTVQPESIIGMWLVKAYGVVVDSGSIEVRDYIDEQINRKADDLLVGSVQAFAGNTLPTGWLLCDGSAVSRTDYADLYAVIGTTYGAGDGTDTFNLPNLTDKFIQGNTTSGTEHSAGLPNISGGIQFVSSEGSEFYIANGAFVDSPKTAVNAARLGTAISTDYKTLIGIDFNATNSSSIYGNSTTVQPPAVTMRYIIKY